jgi:purine-nucleoside/S-methyl-5'-thioadenosine phosphorylase / adenosine deaminase
MIERFLPAGPHHRVRVRCTDRADGDFNVRCPPGELAARRRLLAPGDWTWLRQVHGSEIVDVDRPGAGAGSTADGSITNVDGAVLAIQTADCAPIVFSCEGGLAVVHVGWRGLVAGVIPAALAALREHGGDIHALLGPCIAASAYAFGPDDLDRVVDVVGEVARSSTPSGDPALDLAASVRAQCCSYGVVSFDTVGRLRSETPFDTSDPAWFSHRARGDTGRQVTVAWREAT